MGGAAHRAALCPCRTHGALRHHIANGHDWAQISKSSRFMYGIDKDSYLVRLAKIHLSLLSGGHPNVSNLDTLAIQPGEAGADNDFPEGGFDVLLTNPPFGSKIISASQSTLARYDLAHKWKNSKNSSRWEKTDAVKTNVPPQILFVEQCLNLLRDGGRMGLVLPESLVSNKSHRFVVQYLMDRAHILSVIGMPDALFKTSGKGGTHTKTVLIVAQKDEKRQLGRTTIFMSEAKWCGHDSRARAIPNNDLPAIAETYAKWKNDSTIVESPLGFLLKEEDVENHILCPHYYDPKVLEEIASLSESCEIYKFGDLVENGTLSINTGDELGKLAYGTGNIPFVRTSDISNWEIKHDPKQGVSRTFFEKYKMKQDVRDLDIMMVKDGTYLIGTCAIVTPDDGDIVYQSHIYKIRVNSNKLGITPHLLLAVLSSPVVQRQIRAKQFTMDIIDSLGDRIMELQLPLPQTEDARKNLSDVVEEALRVRSESRKLINQAKELAAGSLGGSRMAVFPRNL
ncbi:N-6 DNA methylase [Yoonia sp.]|uniref:N-6 DNA methylase n=1 Tax=Yoonia sp. TaxID=2212373 RepID=UPI00404774B9